MTISDVAGETSKPAPSGSSRGGLKAGYRLTYPSALLWLAALGLLFLSNACSGGPDEGLQAVIVDQLGATSPNAMFVHDASTVLADQGYEVGYVAAEDVTVNFYRSFKGADIVIFRVHIATPGDEAARSQLNDGLALFTNEPFYEHAHRADANVLRRVWYSAGGPEYFGISPAFIERMDADFGTVILTGCDGLAASALAEAFMKAGADKVLGWTGPVTSTHSDREILRVLRDLDALGRAKPDSVFGSVLIDAGGEQ